MTIEQGLCAPWLLDWMTEQVGDSFKLALYTSDADIGPDTTVYTTTNEVVDPSYTAGGLALVVEAPSLNGRVAQMSFADVTITLSTNPARGALIYNTTRGNRVVGVVNFGRDVIGSHVFALPADLLTLRGTNA